MKYYYSSEGCDYVCILDEFKEIMLEGGEEEIALEEMKRDYGGEMYCNKNEEFPEKGYCGLSCSMYAPRNGKSGRCRYLENGFIGTGKKFILTKSGLKEAENGGI